MAEPAELIQTAAQPDAGHHSQPPAQDVEPQPGQNTASGGEFDELGKQLVSLLADHPRLAEQVAEVIGRYFEGGDRMEQMYGQMTEGGMHGQMMGGGMHGQMMEGGAASGSATAQQASVPGIGDLLKRVEMLERGHADLALERELEQARREYEKLAQQLPVLPEFDEKAILQAALEHPGVPLSRIVKMWAVDKALEGEGSLADRLIAKRMEQSKAAKPPRVEGPGGSVAANYAEPPKDRKEALARAREIARAMFGSVAS